MNKVTNAQIQALIEGAVCEITKMGDKTTVVRAVFENGWVIVESSSCVDPANFDMDIGISICRERIENKLWELEGYALQKELANKKYARDYGVI